MADAITGMDGGYGVTEHSFKRAIPGEIEDVRRRLVDALEQLDYRILSEQPLHAKRGGSMSFAILECPIRLTVALKAINAVSTLATFDYEVTISFASRGDLQTLEKEAEAIIALACTRPVASACATCGTPGTSDSRFCRVCGTPQVGSDPAELEVLRLTTGVRASHQIIITGVIGVFAILVAALSLILFGRPRGVRAGWVILFIGQTITWLTLLYGILCLHRTLNPKQESPQTFTPHIPRPLQGGETNALPPASAWSSVTESTTELLGAQQVERAAAPIKRQSKDTSAVE